MITIHEAAIARGIKSTEPGCYSAGEYQKVGLPFFGGCASCEASMGPDQSRPSKGGHLLCEDCISDFGFETPEEFDQFCAVQIKGAPLCENEALCRHCWNSVTVDGECFYGFCPSTFKVFK